MQVSVTFDSNDGDIGKNLALLASLFGTETVKVHATPMLERSGVVEATAGEKLDRVFKGKPKVEVPEDKQPGKRHRRTKAEMEADRTKPKAKVAELEFEALKEVVEQPVDDFDFGPAEAPPGLATYANTPVNYDLEKDIMPACLAHSRKYGRPKTGEIISQFVPQGSASNVRLIPAEKYPEFMEALS